MQNLTTTVYFGSWGQAYKGPSVGEDYIYFKKEIRDRVWEGMKKEGRIGLTDWATTKALGIKVYSEEGEMDWAEVPTSFLEN